MKVSVKVRFNAMRESFESMGNSKYLLYLPFPEDNDSISVMKFILSRKMGVPAGRIEFIEKDFHKDFIFQLT